MNALHIESERRTKTIRTIGDILIGAKRPLTALVYHRDADKTLRGYDLHEFMRRHADIEVTDQGESLCQRHYTAVDSAAFDLVVIAVEV